MTDQQRAAMRAALEALQMAVLDAKTTPNAYEAARKATAELRAALAESEPSATEQVARWMIAHGYATGHGDSIGDLLHHLRWQVRDETLHGRLNRD